MDNIRKIERTRKGVWTSEALGSLLSLDPRATAVFCSRAVRRGDLVRVKRGVFILPGWTGTASEPEIFALSNILQTPSYVSFATALSFSGATTQIQQYTCEAASPVRTVEYQAEGFKFRYVNFPKRLYFGFTRSRGVFVAEPEKALLDAIYLATLGRYSLDMSSVEWDRFDRNRFKRFLRNFPRRTENGINDAHIAKMGGRK